MHVVQALVSMNVGGSELVATELAEYLHAHGHQSTVVAADGPLAARLQKQAISTVRLLCCGPLQHWNVSS